MKNGLNIKNKSERSIELKTSSIILSAIFATTIYAVPALAFPVDFAPGTPLIDAIRSLGYRAEKNVVINGDLTGTVSLSLADTDFDTAISLLSLSHGFSYEYADGAVVVSPSKTLNKTETFRLNYLDLDAAKKEMELIVDKSKIFTNPDLGTISISGSSAEIEKARHQLDVLDIAQSQISVEATVIELNDTKARDMGLTFSSDSWSKDTSTPGYNGFKFSVTGKHEEQLSKGNILARPSITVFNGRKALIMMGDKVPVFTSSSTSSDASDTTISVDYKDVGVKLECIPRINDEDRETITMVIKPSISTISEWVESGNNKAPQISTREAETIVRVKSGETIIIGGLLKDEEIKSIKQIPFISKIPFFGELFKSRSNSKKKTEIVIAITPKIVYDKNGNPQVKLQETTPALHRKLNDLQTEPKEQNLPANEQAFVDAQNAKLLKESEQKDKELATVKEKYDAALKELEKSKEVMAKVVKKIEEKDNG